MKYGEDGLVSAPSWERRFVAGALLFIRCGGMVLLFVRAYGIYSCAAGSRQSKLSCARLLRTKPSSDRRWGNGVSLWGESASGKEAEKRNNYSSININLLSDTSIWMVFAKRL